MTQTTNLTALPGPTHLPRRVFLGAALVTAGLGAAGALGIAGLLRTPKEEDFRFSGGTRFAPGEENRLRAYLADAASEPRITIRILGHSGTAGAAEANLALSEDRASLVATLAQSVGFPPDRIQAATGLGGGDPLPREAGMGDREYERQLARVTVVSQYQ